MLSLVKTCLSLRTNLKQFSLKTNLAKAYFWILLVVENHWLKLQNHFQASDVILTKGVDHRDFEHDTPDLYFSKLTN